ncbi:MAG TPA: 16S rRNA (adenine(1518)-N(6)/adenine(1519)-N(6))-dimethyltransferase RsmA [Gemmatimonadaceae bacterium]|nr:16S rRNA (adenine(1518)-N(6)/adenine(1519)-N(6))-dimethyltransferase RsmA [Gemmatimonadaceae bacterium]
MSPSDDRRARRASQPPIRKSLGQHFLNDRRILQRIVDALELTGSDTVVEIGPGRGSLSDLLAPLAKRLVLIEIDRMLAARLRDRFAGVPSVSIVEADVLTVDLAAAAGPGPFKVIGNVPYNITTPILFHALRAPRPTRAVYLVQREVAERIVAPPDSEAYGALSVNVQAVASPKLLFRVAAGAFNPPPKVESAVVRIDPRDDPVIREDEEPAFRRFVQDAFGMRRKQLRRVIRAVLGIDVERANAVLDEAGIDGAARPETLAPEAFARLLRVASRDSSARS